MSTKIAELTTEMKTGEMEEITISTNVEAKTWHDLYAHVMEGQWGDGLLPGILSASLPGLELLPFCSTSTAGRSWRFLG